MTTFGQCVVTWSGHFHEFWSFWVTCECASSKFESVLPFEKLLYRYWCTVSRETLDARTCPHWPIWRPITCASSHTWLANFSTMAIFGQICRLLCHHHHRQFSTPWAVQKLVSGRWIRTRCPLAEWLKVFHWLLKSALFQRLTHCHAPKTDENYRKPAGSVGRCRNTKTGNLGQRASKFSNFSFSPM